MKAPILDKQEVPFVTLMPVNRPLGAHVPVPQVILSLRTKAERASILGNVLKRKVKILIQTELGPREVYTTIWAATDDYIMLKSGTAIPLESVIDIRE